ncbi:MAG: hypothetical protein JST46_07325 [Bacteroidetes bacterium]|nr:hypothetical protein [Bacteroidota bacterium]
MRRAIVILSILLCAWGAIAQSRIRMGLGFSVSSGGSFSTYLASTPITPFGELEYEKRLAGSVSLVTGATFFGAAYTTTESSFGSGSKFNAYFIGVPMLMRWNFGNKNLVCFDFGIQPFYLVNARLEETITKFGDTRTYSGDITQYSNRIYVGPRFQIQYMINRLMVGFSVTIPFGGQSSISTLTHHWPLNQQQSTYLGSNGYSDFYITSVKLSYRIK